MLQAMVGEMARINLFQAPGCSGPWRSLCPKYLLTSSQEQALVKNDWEPSDIPC